MKKTKMIMSGVTAAVICAALFSGCGSEKTNNPAPETTASETEISSAETTAQTTAENAEESAGSGYNILVKDENGSPVEGVTVQFCSDTECVLGFSGADGIASFDYPEGTYTVHILEVPDGFAEDDGEYNAASGTTEIVLKAAATKTDTDPDTVEIPEYGMNFTMPDGYKPENTKGTIQPSAETNSMSNPFIGSVTIRYEAVSEEDQPEFIEYSDAWFDALEAGEEPPTPPRPHWDDWGGMSGYVYSIYVIDSGYSEDDIRNCIKESMRDEENPKLVEKIHSEENADYYLVQYSRVDAEDERYRENMGDMYEEYAAFCADRDTFLSAFTFYPRVPSQYKEKELGDTLSLETTDLDGNPVSTKDLFADHKVTMINVWATWCDACKKELPELGDMAKEFEEKGCQIVGLVYDTNKEEKIPEAKQILADRDCEFLNLTAPDNIREILPTNSLPVTYFVDSEGKIIGEIVKGAHLDRYPEVLEDCLAAME